MPEPLTLERFNVFVSHFDGTMRAIADTLDDQSSGVWRGGADAARNAP